MTKIFAIAAASLLALSSGALAANETRASRSDTNKCAAGSGVDTYAIKANCTTYNGSAQ